MSPSCGDAPGFFFFLNPVRLTINAPGQAALWLAGVNDVRQWRQVNRQW